MKNQTTAEPVQGTAAVNPSQKLTVEKSNAKVTPSGKIDEPTPKQVLTVQQRKAKQEELSYLCEKHEKFVESQRKLENFKFSSDGHSQRLNMRDADGNSFETSNPLIIKSVIGQITDEIKKQVVEFENQIIAFQI
ncbi:MAG: hypothetical protein WC760_06435 [Bacteroidia bacterium]|jgi:hypothetical protein